MSSYHTGPVLTAADFAPATDPTFTGQVKISAGSAAAPGVSFAQDASTGLYQAMPGLVGIAVSGVPTLTVGADSLTVGALSGPSATPTRLSLDASYCSVETPSVTQLKLAVAQMSPTEAYGFSVNVSAKLGYHAGGSSGTGIGGHVFYTDGSERLRVTGTGVSTTGGLTVAGDIRTTVSAVALVNDTASTVAFAGAATALTIGADNSGTATIRNSVLVVGTAPNVPTSSPSKLVLAPDYASAAPGTNQQCKLVLHSTGPSDTYGISITSNRGMCFWAGGNGGVGDGSYYAFHTDSAARFGISDTAATFLVNVAAGADNTYNIGSGSYRFKEIFCAAGTINTSDATEKRVRGALTPAEIAVAGELSRSQIVFQWLAALADKGEAARLHVGWTAQQVRDTFAAHGLDAQRYGLFCEDMIFEDAEEQYAAEVAVEEDVDVTDYEMVVMDGRAARRAKQRRFGRPVVDVYPVVDESGAPVLEAQIQPDGTTAMVQATHAVPRTTSVTRTRTVRRPSLDGDGQPRTRLGLRMDQVLAFVTAGLAAAIAG
jgi:hypothetical protein